MKNLSEREQAAVIFSRSMVLIAIFFVVIAAMIISVLMGSERPALTTVLVKQNVSESLPVTDDYTWKAPDESTIPMGEVGEEIRYGKELISNTAKYLGPKGSVAQIANVMNCQNCHHEAGTKDFALNYAAVKSTYPQFKARSGTLVSIADRINGCLERSLNGSGLDTNSKEMLAMIAYMKWLGKDVPDRIRPKNAGIMKLAFLDRAADPLKGKVVYLGKCKTCHGNTKNYPPLWGENSYNDGAGLYRISNFAGFVKNNMPFGASYQHIVLSDEEAWDVAAFVNSQPRPHKDQAEDWKDLSTKPIDFPFGPYADNFSEEQHKYGPFEGIARAHKN
ncbi:c-type cytochrome [Pedobacter insulae]|uniref:Cytochrome c n=1 Tax=Pedobacter insulae TaxID=414048 RepID=A0A1I2UU21_9SPHI|nr:c-type cytochrome [Pedobacter insulae]SFG80520.1 Cytochrome c [Pedobacter insulae]